MIQTEEAALSFAVGRLQWALSRPIRWGESEWAARSGRALAALQTALGRHAASVEARAGLLATVADPALLPFTPAAARVGLLRQQHRDFPERLSALQAQLAGAAQAGADRAFRSLFGVARRAEQLAAEVADHLQCERELRGGAPSGLRLYTSHPAGPVHES